MYVPTPKNRECQGKLPADRQVIPLIPHLSSRVQTERPLTSLSVYRRTNLGLQQAPLCDPTSVHKYCIVLVLILVLVLHFVVLVMVALALPVSLH